jgi:hypothetical protein
LQNTCNGLLLQIRALAHLLELGAPCGLGVRLVATRIVWLVELTRSDRFVAPVAEDPNDDRRRALVCDSGVIPLLIGWGESPSAEETLVPWSGIEPPTPSLPRTCSAPELPRLRFVSAVYKKARKRALPMSVARDGHFMRPMRLFRCMRESIAPMRQSPAYRPAANRARPTTAREKHLVSSAEGEFDEFVATPRTDGPSLNRFGHSLTTCFRRTSRVRCRRRRFALWWDGVIAREASSNNVHDHELR